MRKEKTDYYFYEDFPNDYKVMHLQMHSPKFAELTWRQIFNFYWGFDIFIGEIPFLKAVVFSNLVVWGLMLYAK